MSSKNYLFCLCLGLCMGANAQETLKKSGLKVGIVQASLAWGDVEENLRVFGERISKCGKGDLVVLPELFVSGCLMKKRDKQESFEEKVRIASYYNSVVDSLKRWAITYRFAIMGSTVYEENEKFYNRLVVAFPDGSYCFYDKRNCFKMGGYTPGNKQLIFDYKGYKIATYICYDLRFPEWSKNNSGYDVAIYVANWPETRHDDWKLLLKDRAIENKAYIVGVNCCGEDSSGLKYVGGSQVLNRKGNIIGKCNDFTDEIVWVRINR